jgi:predicted ribosomally synthesized peptide with nif11-like leader
MVVDVESAAWSYGWGDKYSYSISISYQGAYRTKYSKRKNQMSKEVVRQFLAKANEDKDLLASVEKAGKDVNALVAAGAAAGYNFTAADVEAAVKDIQSQVGELSENELETVAGGAGGKGSYIPSTGIPFFCASTSSTVCKAVCSTIKS